MLSPRKTSVSSVSASASYSQQHMTVSAEMGKGRRRRTSSASTGFQLLFRHTALVFGNSCASARDRRSVDRCVIAKKSSGPDIAAAVG